MPAALSDTLAVTASTTAVAQPDHCPRCGADFHCGLREPTPCPCTTITLSGAALMDLRVRYDGCVCLRCLGELAGAPTPPR